VKISNDVGPSSIDVPSQEPLGSASPCLKNASLKSIAETYIPSLLVLANPLLGVFSSYVISYLGDLFGSGPPDVFQQIMKIIPSIVRKEIMHNNLESVQQELLTSWAEETFGVKRW